MNKGSIPKKVLNIKIKTRCLRGRKNKTKMGTTGYKKYHTEGRKNTRESSGAGGLVIERQTERPGCWTTLITWKCVQRMM
jgi:hypothetical protein